MMDVVSELANPSRYAGVFTQRDGEGCVVSQVASLVVVTDVSHVR